MGQELKVVRVNFLEDRMLFKESYKEGGNEGEGSVFYTKETVHAA